MRVINGAVAAIVLAFSTGLAAAEIDIPYQQFTLDNGLRVVVHEDHKAPLVAVSIWYHVGSKDEPKGRTGFAHLYEHLMYNGSENFDDDWFGPLEEVGATDLNGNTWFDRTNYFQTVPTPALDRVLWMESDRMGHLLGAVTQEKLDEQRSVVQNEKRQGDNQPYGRMGYATLAGMLPEGHPYSHSTLGSMEDLEAADLESVKDWFSTYYGAANAVLVLAGDIDAAVAREKAERFFGDIPAGPPLSRMKEDAPQLAVNKREIMYDRVPQSMIDRNWVAPGRNSKDAVFLTLAATILGGGKTSRLYQSLVYDQEIATSATASLQEQELLSFYSVTVEPKNEVTPEAVEVAMEKVLADFLAKGPTVAELDRAKTSIEAAVLRGLEQVGGTGGKAATLGQGALYADDPGFFSKQLDWLKDATPQQVLAAARAAMNAGYYQLTVLPYPEFSTIDAKVDRSAGLPAVTQSPDLKFPPVEEATLKNGIKVVLANRPTVPVINISMQFDAGYAADSVAGGKLGAASFAGAMMDEGTKRRTALKIAEEQEALGATLSVGSNLDMTGVTLSALKDKLGASLDLMADVVRNPAFDVSEIDKLRARWIAGIAQEKASPVQLALRILPPMIYGDGHAYGVPFTGSGTEASINSLTREDLTAFHRQWIRPDNAVVFVTGDATMSEIKPALEKAFGDWKADAAAIPAKNIAIVQRPATGKVVIVDKPGSPQSLILAGHIAPPTGADNNIALTAMNDILGGQFSARVNMNLREDKGWAYGAYTFFQDARGQRPYLVYAPVQTDKTKEALAELVKELNAFNSTRPATAEELKRTIDNNTRSLPGSYETSGDVLGSLLNSNRFGRDWNYPTTLKERYESLTLGDIAAASKEAVHPESLIWVIVGDRKEIEADVRSLNYGDVEIMSVADL